MAVFEPSLSITMPYPNLDQCATALSDPSAALLVGAGASAAAELPTWRALLEEIGQKIGDPFDKAISKFTELGRYLEAAQTARMAVSHEQEWFRLLERFDTRGVTTSTWKLLCSLGISKIVTTNWDNIAEDSFAAVWTRVPSMYVGIEEILTPLTSTYPHVLHPHGKAPRWKTILFAQSEYQTAEQSPRYREFWIDLLTKRPLLIVAFSGADPAFQHLVDYVEKDLGVGHLIQPFVIHPDDQSVKNFGPRAVSIPYSKDNNHAELREILKELRDKVKEERRKRGVDDNPLQRGGLHPSALASKEDLLMALLGLDIRGHCGSESFLALVILIRRLLEKKEATLDDLVEETSSSMRVSAVEAQNAVENAAEVAISYGWVTKGEYLLQGTARIPQLDREALGKLIQHIYDQAQSPMSFSKYERVEKFIKDALLAYYRVLGSSSANSLMGLENVAEIEEEDLHSSLRVSGLTIGAAGIERQVCRAVVRVAEKPPDSLKLIFARLSSFAIITELASVSRGRELLRGHGDIGKLYLDTNIILPALAIGHKWHSRCASLVEKCRRGVTKIIALGGFVEELEIQFADARRIAGQEKTPESFLLLCLSKGSPNGFMDGFAGWASGQGTKIPTFNDYCSALGLGERVTPRLAGLGIDIAQPPKSWGRYGELHARIESQLAEPGRHEKLVRHEADQLALLALENEGQLSLPSKFVTAHKKLRDFLVRSHSPVAAAVVPPVALDHLLSAVNPSAIPPASLRELAFEAPGMEIAEAVYGVLLSKWRGQPEKLARMVSEEVSEKLRDAIRGLTERFSGVPKADVVDARRRLLDVIVSEIVPKAEDDVSKVSRSTKLVADPMGSSENLAGAAARLARETSNAGEE